jgi:hypothetical protein
MYIEWNLPLCYAFIFAIVRACVFVPCCITWSCKSAWANVNKQMWSCTTGFHMWINSVWFLIQLLLLTHNFMSILWKMAVFIEKSPVTSSNCYKTIKKCFNTNQTWHKCWLDHCLCNNMPRLKFPVTIGTRGHLKIAKNHYFALIFSIKIEFKMQLLNGLR